MKTSALFLSIALAISPVAFAQQQGSAAGTGAGAGAATGAAAAGVSVGVATAVVAGVAVAAAVSANKADPVYTTTNSGTGTVQICIANC
jgi:hypothetical protein|nr:hypothetical protein [uncultured Limnohabitans sp.]